VSGCPVGQDVQRAAPDVVYVCRNGENPELRYSLRSLANLDHGRVWLVGGRPAWARTRYVSVPQATRDKVLNVRANLRALVATEEISEEFYLFNDDFYVMRKVASVPPMHRGLLSEAEGATRWHAYMHATDAWLKDRGVAEPLNYELHVPLPMTKSGLSATLDLIGSTRELHYRSVFGNLAQIGGERSLDVKVYRATDRIPDGDYLSSSDSGFRGSPLTRHVTRAFRHACEHERGRRA
jgi:hypothetical protein